MLARSLTRSALARSVPRASPALLRIATCARQPASTTITAPLANISPAFSGVRSFSTTMSAHAIPTPTADNTRPAVDKVVQDIADYVHDYEIKSDLAVRYSIPYVDEEDRN